jgi:hypothetical protein
MGPLIRAAEPSVALVTVPNVELLEVGQEWETSTGVFDFTQADLASCIASQDDPSLRTPVVKLGHVDTRQGFDGQPAFGKIENLRLTNNDQTLVGDLVGVPLWLAQIMATAYPRRSIEGQFEFTSRTGNTWPMVLTGVALLGDAYPAIDTLEDIKAMWGAEPPVLHPVEDVEEIAASGNFFKARKVDDVPNWLRKKEVAAAGSGPEIKASVSLDTVRRSYYEALDASQMWWWIREVRVNPLSLIVDDDEGGLYEVPVTAGADDSVGFGEPKSVKIKYVAASGAPVPERPPGQILAAAYERPEDTGRSARNEETVGATMVPSSNTDPVLDSKEQSPMDLTDDELAALGLSPGATREQISAAILGQRQEGTPDDGNPASQPETPATEPAAQPATSPEYVQPAPGQPAGEPVAVPTQSAPVVPDGMVLIDQAMLDELKTGVAASGELIKQQQKRERDELLDTAIRAGKFGKGRRAHYEGLLLSDPIGGKATILSLADGVVPTAERGEHGNSTSDPEGAKVDASYPASWGRAVSASRRGLGDRVKVVGD